MKGCTVTCVRGDSDGTYPEVQHVRLLVALDFHEYLYNYSALFTCIRSYASNSIICYYGLWPSFRLGTLESTQ